MSVMARAVKAGETLSTIDGSTKLLLDSEAQVYRSNTNSYKRVESVNLGEGKIISWAPMRIHNNPLIEPQTMKWDVLVGSDRIVFWSPQSGGIVGGVKEIPGKATVGFYLFDSLFRINFDILSDENFCLQFYALVEGNVVMCAIEGSREKLLSLINFFMESFIKYYGTSLDQNSVEVLSMIPLRFDSEKTFVDPFISIEKKRIGGKISLIATEKSTEQQIRQGAERQTGNLTIVNGQAPTLRSEQSTTADEIMEKRQELHELKTAVELQRREAKDSRGVAIVWSVVSIGWLITLFIWPGTWYLWLLCIGCVIWDIRTFLKANTLLREAEAYEQLIPSVEREIRELERKGGM